MPAPSIKALAKKSGKSEAEAEKLWSKAKEEAKGSKLKDGSTVPDKESAFKDKDWAYVTGIFKKMLGLKESLDEDGIISGFGSSGPVPSDRIGIAAGYGRRPEDIDNRNNPCPTPGRKIRSKGKGRGMAIGQGRGPIGRMGEERYRVVIDGDEVQMIHNGAQVPLGENGNVELVREKIQDLLDHDIDSVFQLGGFVGTLSEIEQRVLRDWVMFCTGGKPSTSIFGGGG